MIAEKVLVGMVTSDNNFVNFAGFTILQILVAIGKKSLISGVIFGFIISYIVHKLIRKKYDLDEI